MKPGEIYVATSKDDKHIDGHRFELLRQEKRWPAGDVWVSKDVDTGAEHHWALDHFKSTLKLAK